MARKWQSGLELNSTGADVDITGTVGGGLSIVSTQAHGGTYSAQLASMTSATAKGFYYTYLGAEGTAHLFFRTYLRVATRPSAENRIMIWNDSTATAIPGIYITLGSDGTLKLYDEDGVVAGGSGGVRRRAARPAARGA